MQKDMPIGDPTLVSKPTWKDIKNPSQLWFVKAVVYIPPQKYPPIPVRTEAGLTHPVGIVECHVAGIELIHAVEKYNCKVINIPWGVYFKGSNEPFKEYVTDLYSKRLVAKKDKNMALSEVLKLFMNSLYGGFAQPAAAVFMCGVVEASAVEYLEKVHGVEMDLKLDNKYHLVSYKKGADYTMWKEIPDEDPAKEPESKILNSNQNPLVFPMEVNVAIAAQVTAYGRALIREMINSIHQAGGVVAYSATDSVYTDIKLEDNPKFSKLVGKDLGQFKLEREFKEGYFARTGLYALSGCTGGKETVIKHTSYNRPDISVQDVKELALYGRILKRVKATWSQATVTDKLGLRGAFS
jgi:hypothetical protein